MCFNNKYFSSACLFLGTTKQEQKKRDKTYAESDKQDT